jgi:hypothetical protein
MLSNIYAECHTFLYRYAECHYGKCRSVVTILAVRQCDSAGIDPLVVSSRLTSFTYYLFSLLDTCASRGVLGSISLKEQKFALKDIQSNLIMTGSRGASTLSITTFSLTTLSIMTFSMMTLSITAEHCYAACRLCCTSLMQSVTYKPFMLSVLMLSVLMLNVVMLSAWRCCKYLRCCNF